MFFFFNDTATTEIYTLSLHDALPISSAEQATERHRAELASLQEQLGNYRQRAGELEGNLKAVTATRDHALDRKSTRLNSSHANISYAVFCLKKKKRHNYIITVCTHNI